MSAGRPTEAHERRATFLCSLAMLAGCTGSMGGQFPDGCRPDVIRYAAGRRLVFLGDAKDTETPGCRATRARLAAYLRWLRAHDAAGGAAIFAVCFGRRGDAEGWFRTMVELAHREGVACVAGDITEFEPDLLVSWLLTGRGASEVPARLISD